ncbi:hypothetical protein SDC9_43315 [bioreactor metagenome]|uniref:Uncharacterized protein n=1 Tax=bioreactor metagenome TaxID=1076179 RepID=A0A644W0L7_9ZZZZ
MAIGRGAGIDRLVQLEMGADAARRQVHARGNDALDLLVGRHAGAVGVGIDRQRFRHADRIAHLDQALLRQPRRNDVLREVARRIGGRAVDLGRVLAREGPAAMRRGAAIGVDDDLAAREPRVAIRPADHEGARRVHPPFGLVGDPALGQDLADIGLDDRADVGRTLAFILVLGREHDRGHADRATALVAHRQLRFRIGAERRLDARFAHLGEATQDRVAVEDRRRHQLGGLVGRVTEHDALIARPVLVDALADMGRLRVQVIGEVQRRPVELVLLVADVLDAVAHDAVDAAHELGELRLVRQPDLAADDDLVGGGKRLAGDAGVRFLGDQRVEHRIRDAVADLVGVSFRNGFGGEHVILSCHGEVLHW